MAISGACSGKWETSPAYALNYRWSYSVEDRPESLRNKAANNRVVYGGMGLHEQKAYVGLYFPDFAQIDEFESYGGNIEAGTNITNKTNFSLTNKGGSESFKLSGTAEMNIEKVLYQMYEDGRISCKGDFDFAQLMPRNDEYYDEPQEQAFDLRGNSSVHSLSLTHNAVGGSGNYTVKYTGQIELDVANACSAKAQNGAWYSSENFAVKSLSCKGGPAIKVKISFNGVGSSVPVYY